MSHIVISRKWRPQTFTEVIGQEHITRSLVNSIKTNRVAHAYLFSGPRGVGKTTVARILAKALNCENGPTPEPCNQCPSCKEITTGRDIDVIEIDGASNRGIDEIRSLRERILLAPVRGRYKVYIIDEVHMLTTEAFNALLKTLEEPPPYVVFIFATTRPEKVPTTILSRCLHFQFGRVAVEMIVERLKGIISKESVDADEDALYYIARKSEGCVRDAESLLEQMIAFSEGRITLELVQNLLEVGGLERAITVAERVLAGDVRGALEEVKGFQDEGGSVRHLYDTLIDLFHKIMLVKTGIDDTSVLNISDSQVEKLKAISEGVDISDVFAVQDSLVSIKADYLRGVGAEVALDMAIIRGGRLVKGLPISMIESLGIEGIVANTGRNQKLRMNTSGSVTAEQPGVAVKKSSPESKTIKGGNIWSEILNIMKGKSMQVWGILNDAKFIGIEGGKLRIGFTSSKEFHIERMNDMSSKRLVMDAYKSLTGDDIEIEVSVMKSDDGEGTSEEVKKDKNIDETIQRELRRFGGRIISGG
ncbi:MAG: DNA polymerase III subunit gamma/tau [Candidatus Coatesbacteria bacterium]|nr:MAG: DNA polymerase III subunit gamma/tau [Candidatus Coatesbacteria bacterium]